MDNNALMFELHKQHHAGQQRYTYFILAASGACIAYGVERAVGVPLNYSLLWLALAVTGWASSFYYGCKSAITVQALIGANVNQLKLKTGTHGNQPATQEELGIAIREVGSAIAMNMEKATSYSNGQFTLFVVGSVFFVVWRVTEIIRLAPIS